MREVEEQTILYCIIHDFDCLIRAISKINEDYFFTYQSKAAYREILACYTENNKIDIPILYSWVKKNDSIKIITSDFLIQVAECGTKTDINNFNSYLNQLVLRFKSNQYRILLEKKHNDIISNENYIDSEINGLMSELNILNEQCSIQSIEASDIETVKNEIISRISSGKSNISFGYSKIDEFCKPEAGGLVFIGGRPGTGKTTFAMNCALRNSRFLKIGFLSYEMPDYEVLERLCQIENKHNKRFYSMQEYQINDQIEKFKSNQIDIYDLHGKTELPIREIMENNEYDLVIIDHAHEITSSKKFKDERLKYNYIAGFIDQARKSTGQTVFCLLQISREVDTGRPLMRHLKESAAFEEKGQVVCFLYERLDLIGDQKVSDIEVIFAKNRFGSKTNKDDIILKFNKSTMNFY